MRKRYFENLMLHKDNLLFISLLLVFLTPVWAFQYFPSQDGPAHVYNSSLILSFYDPAYDIFSEYLEINPNIDPTWFGHLILAGLMILFPVLIAEKILISIYVILLLLGARYALGAIKPESRFLSILFFPLVYNYLLHMGFYAFSLSLAVGLFVLGYWLKNYDNLTLKKIIILWFLTILLYFNHVVSLGMVCIIIGCVLFGRIVFDIAENAIHKEKFFKMSRYIVSQKVMKTIYAFFPSVMMAAFFILSRDTISNPGANISSRLYNLIHMMPVVSFSAKEVWVTSLFMLFLIVISAHVLFFKIEHKKIDCRDFLLLSSFVCLAFYLIVPEPVLVSQNGMSGGLFMDMRVSYYIYFTLILWIGVQPHSKVLKHSIQLIAVVTSIGLIFLNVSAYKKINLYLDEYLSAASLIEPNTTLLSLDSCGGVWNVSYRDRIKPFLHASNYIAAERKVMALRNYEATMGYFPFVFRLDKNPYSHIGALECYSSPPPANFLDYPDRTGGQIDYVTMWLGKKVQQNHENILSIYRQLEEGYDLIYESPKGLLELYRRKSWVQPRNVE